MLKTLVVAVSMLLVSSSAYAENEQVMAKCLGMSSALELPDKDVFGALLYRETEDARTKFGIKSDEYNTILRGNAELIGWGSGYASGLLQNNGKTMLLSLFMHSCYNGSNELRDKMLASFKLNTGH